MFSEKLTSVREDLSDGTQGRKWRPAWIPLTTLVPVNFIVAVKGLLPGRVSQKS